MMSTHGYKMSAYGYTIILGRWGYWMYRGTRRLAHRHRDEFSPGDSCWYITHRQSCAKCGEYPSQKVIDVASLTGILHE